MPDTMDAFIRAVEDARHQLIRQEGQNVSVRELVRRAGFDESQRAGVTYHLNPKRHDGSKAHRVPADVVKKLAAVLPVSEDELSHAAQVAAGFTVADTNHPDVAVVLQRFYGDTEVTEEEKRQVTSRVLQIIAQQTTQSATGQ